MNITFIIILLTTLFVYLYGYPAYKLNQEEDRIRTSMKNIPSNATANNLSNIAGVEAHSEILNQYPKFVVYIFLDHYKEVKLDPKISAFVKSFSCASIDNLKTYPQLKRQATLNIMKDDHHEFKYIIQNTYGTLYTHRPVMSDCPNFQSVLQMKEA